MQRYQRFDRARKHFTKLYKDPKKYLYDEFFNDAGKKSRGYQRYAFDKIYSFAQRKYNQNKNIMPYKSSRKRQRPWKAPTRPYKRPRGKTTLLYGAKKPNKQKYLGGSVSKTYKALTYKKQKSAKLYRKLGVGQTYENGITMGGITIRS